VKHVWAVLIAGAAGFALAAPEPTTAQQSQAPFRTTVARVRLDAMVTDRGRPIAGLTAADFEVKDNGTVVTTLEVEPIDAPVGVAIALDVGRGAREDGLKELVAACEALARALGPRDQAWLLTFSSTFALKAGPTNDPVLLGRVLADVKMAGESAVWDALFGAVSLAAGRPGRALVLLFTDGADQGEGGPRMNSDRQRDVSWMTERKSLGVLHRADVVVSGIRPPGVLYGFNALEAAANATGGRVLYAQRGVKLDTQFVDLLREFRSGYVLSYPPPALTKDGWHEVDVKLKGRRGTVRVREGYYEPRK
jgi:VWFA-related protein